MPNCISACQVQPTAGFVVFAVVVFPANAVFDVHDGWITDGVFHSTVSADAMLALFRMTELMLEDACASAYALHFENCCVRC